MLCPFYTMIAVHLKNVYISEMWNMSSVDILWNSFCSDEC
jgi:hypothetical protein